MSKRVISLFDGAGKPTAEGGPGTDTPHISGPCRCDACDHAWIGVAPVGTSHLECPKCHRDWGIFKHPVEPPEGGKFWRCNCGNELFWLTPTGAMCRGCGLRSNDWAN